MINNISDLKIGNEYFTCFVKDARFAKKRVIEKIINEYKDDTELYLKRKIGNKIHYNLVFCCEIGIGDTKIEAKNNYGKLKKQIL